MSKFISLRKFIFGILIFSLGGCHTYIFQPVKKQIKGTWVVIPTTTDIIKFRFDGSTLFITLNDTGKLDTTPYVIQNRLTKHTLSTVISLPPLEGIPEISTIEKWHIVNLNKEELYISSIDPPRIGNAQISFIKIN